MKIEYTREFLAYCKAQGRSPSGQLEHDRQRFPGGIMCGFICWMSRKLEAFKVAHPESCIGHHIADHDAKCAFLEASQ